MEPLTIETFSPNNRDKKIGSSLFRICKQNEPPYKWYIVELYNNQETGGFGIYKDYYSPDLQTVLDAFNAITEENALMRKREREIWGEDRKEG